MSGSSSSTESSRDEPSDPPKANVLSLPSVEIVRMWKRLLAVLRSPAYWIVLVSRSTISVERCVDDE